jgi:flavin reductase (DIM6/NTAB) family NADH-FMN oxidoreductase RutF
MTPPPAPAKLRTPVPPGRFFGYYPGPVAVVTAAVGERRNAMSAGWHTALSHEPPLYGVSVGPGRHTHGLLSAAEGFVVNFLGLPHASAIHRLGTTSGRDGDKLAALGLDWTAGAEIAAPILDAAYFAYECRTVVVRRFGDHDLFVGRVVATHHRPDAYDEHGVLRPAHTPPAIYLGRGEYRPLA